MSVEEIIKAGESLIPVVAIALSWASLNAKVKQLEISQKEIKEDVKVIRENHLAHLQDAYMQIKEDVAVMKAGCAIHNAVQKRSFNKTDNG